MDKDQNLYLTPEELDAIGEIMNMSIGASATALSTMLEKQVSITTPETEQEQFKEIDCSDLEPAIVVKIRYVSGLEGSNVTMFKRRDLQIILGLLTGNEGVAASDDFVFDDMSMSAACEVMNQMMGSSATALSEVLGIPILISTPETLLVETKDETQEAFSEIRGEDHVVSISFRMMIKGVLNTTFRCFMPIPLAKEVVSSVSRRSEMIDMEERLPTNGGFSAAEQSQQNGDWALHGSAPGASPEVRRETVPEQATQVAPRSQAEEDSKQFLYTPQRQVAYAPPAEQRTGSSAPPIKVKSAGFPSFSPKTVSEQIPYNSNMKLLMDVQLEVSVIVGRTKRKIKDILEFGQGTVVLLDTQTGAPAEVVVNGQLLAYGDVVVVGDNFGVRITEIVGTKELMDSLSDS